MRLGFAKQVLAAGLIVALLSGDILTTVASNTDDKEVQTMQESDSVSGNDAGAVLTAEDLNKDDEEQLDETVSDGDLAETVLSTEVSGVTITLTAPAGAVPEGAELWAEEITSQEELAVIDTALEKKATEETQVQRYKAFDIKLLVDGEAVQPDDSVKVTFAGDIMIPQNANESLEVYHVTDDAVANEMPATVAEDGAVEMETNHFSTFVLAYNLENGENLITVSHYLAEDADKEVADRQKFYKSAEVLRDAENGVVTVPVQGGTDYKMTKMVIKDSNGNTLNELAQVDILDSKAQVSVDANASSIELYYAPTENPEHMNDVTYFDYSIMTTTTVEEDKSFQPKTGDSMSFTYKGVAYSDFKFVSEGTFSGKNAEGKNVTFSFNGRDTLTDVTYNDGNITWTTDKVSVYVLPYWNYVYFQCKAQIPHDNVINSGINQYGKGHEKNYLAMGTKFHNYELMVTKNGEQINADLNNATNGGNVEKAIVPNLVTGLTDDYKDIVTGEGVYEPGYFNEKPLEGKTIYDDRFELKFDRQGHTYKLVSSYDKVSLNETKTEVPVKDSNGKNIVDETGKVKTEINKSFFPLNDVPYDDTEIRVNRAEGGNGWLGEVMKKGNAFFGMRYDFSFSLGDYVGPMTYTFVGDDDLWVFVDGHKVLDLGGMHQAYPSSYSKIVEPNTVDLWNAVDENGNKIIDPNDTTKEHQVTVLYMERGGYDSSCYMEFVIPNVTPMDSVIQKPADFELTKVDENTKEPLSGATFTFTKYTEKNHKTVDTSFGTDGSIEVVSNGNGKLRFSNVEAGYYTLQEIEAPSGYYLSDKVWNVVATADAKTGKVSISIEGLTDNTITNKPVDVTPGAEKTAKLVDWEKRVYKLDLKALATEKTIANTKDANVLLLVDTSGSMTYTDAQIDADQLDKSKIYFTKTVSKYTDGYYVTEAVSDRLLSTAKLYDWDKIYFRNIPLDGDYVFYDTKSQAWYKKAVSYSSYGRRYYNLSDTDALSTKGATKVDPSQMTLYTNRSEVFVNAAEQFVNGLTDGSKISVVTFGKENNANVQCEFTDNKTSALNAVRKATGVDNTATYAASGFNKAGEIFDKLGSYTDSYVVFFTDGALNDSSSAVNAANSLKNKGIQIYAIGVGEGNTSSLNSIATSEAYVKKCNNMADVADALTSLGLSSSGKIEGVKIVDEISPFFELCDQDGNVITSLEGATISYQDGKQVITWDNETVPFGETGLTKTIYVKARDNFAGGNYVETNNKYTVTFPDGKTTDKETPHVNVKSSIKAGEAEDTIFLGETLEDYVTKERQQEVAGVTYDENGKIISITGENGKTYTDLEYVNVSVQWKDAQGNDVTFEDIKKAAPTADTKYTATVTVAPKFATDSAEAKQAAEAMAKDDKVLYTMATISATGTYTIKVVTGQIDVVKKIKKDDITYIDGDPIFTFQIEANGKTQTRMVRFTEKEVKNLTVDEEGYVALSVSFEKLEKGCYTVKELSTIGYTLESKSVDTVSTNCKYDDTIKFAIGQKDITENATDLEATYGKAVYKNKASQDPKDSDKDMVVNKVVIENGKVVIKPQTVPDQSK